MQPPGGIGGFGGRPNWPRTKFWNGPNTEAATPYLSQPLISDKLTLALHRPRTVDQPMLVFRDPAMHRRVAALREAEFAFDPELPRGLDPATNALLRSPEGTLLLLLQED